MLKNHNSVEAPFKKRVALMQDELDNLRHTAIEYAKTSGALTDIEKAAVISKAVAEEKKAIADMANSGRSFRDSLTSGIIGCGGVLVFSVMGLIGTSIYNVVQLSYNQRQAETSEWRELLAAIDKTKNNNISSNIILPFRLRSFMKSSRYANDVRGVATRVMGRMADVEGLKSLFSFVFSDPDSEDIKIITDLARQLTINFNRNSNFCQQISEEKGYRFSDEVFKDICFNGYTDKQGKDFGLSESDAEVWTLRRNHQAYTDQMAIISQYIARYLNRNSSTSNKSISLRDIRDYIKHDSITCNFRTIDITADIF